MKTSTTTLRKLVLLSTVLILLTFLSCKDDPVSPQEEKPIETTTIGTEGGTIQKDDFTLTIPPGAFDKNYDISVSGVANDGAFAEDTVSNWYNISGIPQNYKEPLRFKIKYKGNTSINQFLAIGKSATNNLSGESSIVYNLYNASDSSGYLIGYLPINVTAKLYKSSVYNVDLSLYLGAVLYYEIFETENFKIKFPLLMLKSSIAKLGEILEETYKISHDDLKLSLTLNEGEKWDVLLINQKYAVGGEIETININSGLIINSDYEPIKINLLEYFISTYVFVLHSTPDRTQGYKNNYWLVSAISAWAQKYITTDPGYKYPDKFLDNAMEPFNGIEGAQTTGGFEHKIVAHGIGMSSLIKYLVEDESFGLQELSKTYNDFANGSYLTDALLNNKDGLLVDWLHDFYKKYINNEIYDLPKNYFSNNAHQVWNVNNNSDTLKVFAAKNIGLYPDLSARIFKINLNYGGFDAAQNLLLKPKAPSSEFGLSLVLFGVQNENIFHLGTAHAQDYEIPNLKGYYDAGMTQFLVVLVNGLGEPPFYLGQSDIDLTMKINLKNNGGGQTDLTYNRCFIEVYVVADFFDTRYAEAYEHYTGPIRLGTENEYDPSLRSIEGSFLGNTFTGTFIGTGDREGQSSTATVILNEAHDMVLEYSWAEVDTSLAGLPHGIRSVSGVSGLNIPIKNSEEGLFELRGANACSGVSTLLSFTEWEDLRFGQVYKDSSTVEGFNCDENSRVIIQFSEE